MSNADSELLKEAIQNDDAAAIAGLCDAGVDLNYEYYWSYPIHEAVFLGRLNAICTLAKKGANLNVIGLRNAPPIMIAAEDRRPEVVTLLMELGANPDAAQPTRQYTALFTALWRQRSLPSARVLVENGADIFKIKDLNGNNAVRFAVHFECEEILNVMVKIHGRKAKSAIAIARLDFALIAAARANDIKRVAQSLSAKANVNAIDPYGWFALFLASENGNTEMIRVLLKSGARVSLSGEGKKTALMAAALGGHRESVELLLNKGADLLEEVIPGERLADGRDMDAVAFAREGPNSELYEYLRGRREELKRVKTKQEKEAAARKVKGRSSRSIEPEATAKKNVDTGKTPVKQTSSHRNGRKSAGSQPKVRKSKTKTSSKRK